MPVEMPETKEPPELVLLMKHLADSPVTAHHNALWTRRDPVLSPVVQALQHGWTDYDQSQAPFYSRRSELSLFNGCIFWGSRVVIPQRGWKAVLGGLHMVHSGMSRMKSLIQIYVWWPGMDTDIGML